MQISDYLPKLYENNLEMLNIINSEQKELENNLKPKLETNFNNTFATKADEQGISKFEKILDIKPNIYTDTLQLRRERVMNRLVSQIPYTEKFLIQKLDEILGKDNYTYTINYNDYSLTIQSIIPGKTWYDELNVFLSQILPCNIIYNVIVYAASWYLVEDSFNTWNDLLQLTWEELADAEWND